MPTALEQLLARLAAEGGAPLPEPANSMPLGPLSTDTSRAFQALNPEPVPPRFIQPAPVDQGFVSNYAGAAPTPPAPLSRAQRIFNAIGGFGAGFQGNGGQFLEQLRQPERDYNRQREQYEDRRTRGIELAERRAEREAEQANRMNELAYERDFKLWLQKNGDRSDEAKQRMAHAFTLERDARAARLAEEQEQRRERRAKELDAKQKTSRYFTVTKNMALSRELGAYHAGLTGGLSPEAARLDRRVQAMIDDTRGGGVGGTGRRRGPTNEAQAALDRFNQARQALITALQQGNGKAADAYRQAMNRAFKSLARFPRDVEMFSQNPDWPFAQMRNSPAPTAAPAGAQQQPQSDPLGVLR